MTSADPPKLAPHNIEAEQMLIGSLLYNNQFLGTILSAIDPAHFFEPLHGHIFHQISKLVGAGQAASAVTLKDAFPDIDVIQGMPLRMYLAKLQAAGVNSAIETETLAVRVRDLARMRDVIQIGDDLRRAGADGAMPDEALKAAWDRLDDLRSDGAAERGMRGSINVLAPQLLETESSHVASTGLVDLDTTIAGGWRSGRLYILAGRPGMGKTVLAVSSARRVARRKNAVSIFSLEIDVKEVLARMTADELARSATPIPYRDIVAGDLDETSRARVAEGVERIQKLPIEIDCSGGLSIAQIEARARIDKERFARAGQRLSVVMIDYLGLIKATDRYRGQKVHELGELALAGKNMAKRLDCAVVMLAQLNRSVESRDDKRPTMSDLRDSGNIEEHADFVGLLYRPFYYIERSAKWIDQDPQTIEHGMRVQDSLELIIGKNRLGGTKVVHLWCDPSVSAVDNKRNY